VRCWRWIDPQAQAVLERHHGDIVSVVAALKHCFAADSADVQREWARYTAKVRALIFSLTKVLSANHQGQIDCWS